jgi:excisionase family DNA binding protein
MSKPEVSHTLHAVYPEQCVGAGRPMCCSVYEAARVLGIGRTSLYGLLRDGRLDARKIGRRTVVLTVSLDRLVASLPPGRISRTEQAIELATERKR